MTSKLFHTVVGIGISLGAMSMGCSSETGDESASTEAAQTETNQATVEPAAPVVEKDRFCEVAWPTTKGGPRPAKAHDCIDPKSECGVYPGGIFSQQKCVYAEDPKSCDIVKPEIWMFCKATIDGRHEWTCPDTTIAINKCIWPTPEAAAEADAKNQNGY